MLSRTLILSVAFGAVLGAGAAGCAGTVPGGKAQATSSSAPSSRTPSASAKPTGTRKPSGTPTATAAVPTGFPTTARAYAEDLLAAWSQRQVSRLNELTTPPVAQQILQTPGLPDQQWTYQRCDGAAGSSYCSFSNADGDVITLRMINQQVGAAHAASEMRFDRTAYPNDAVEYVKGFVEAWRNANTMRMRALSGPSEVDYFRQYTPPDTYSVCTFQTDSVWQVRLFNSSGLNYLIRVTTTALGTKHAISGHIAPVPVPPPCP